MPIPHRKALPTVTPDGVFEQMVSILVTETDLHYEDAPRVAELLLARLGLYPPTPELKSGQCTAFWWDDSAASATDDSPTGWVQCDEEPSHVEEGNEMHRDGSHRWHDSGSQTLPAPPVG